MNHETPETLLKGALERIVYFEARSTQLANDVERSAAEATRLKAELARAAQREIDLKRTVAELEVKVSRAHAEREEASVLVDALRRERADVVGNILDAARIHGTEVVDGFDLAQFIAQLRSEVLHLREGEARPVPAPAEAQDTEGTPATRMARHLKSTGRLSVSEADVNTLTNGTAFPPQSDETLFGFSVRELSAPDVAARARAAERLAALAQRAAAPALAAALNVEQEPSAQVAMLRALAELAGPEGAAVVKTQLTARSAEVRIAALKAFLKLDPAAAGPHLAAATSDPEPAVRRRASLLALGLPPKAALELGTTAIRDQNPDVRALATLVLSAGQAEAARPLLLEALRDPDVKVRRSASQALSNLLGQDVTPVVGLTDAHRRREVRRLASVQPMSVSQRRSRLPAPLGTDARPPWGESPGAGGGPPPAASDGPTLLPPASRAVGFLASSPSQAALQARTTVVTLPDTTELDERLLAELRASLRGKSLPDLTEAAGKAPDDVRRALSGLLSKGAVVRRGLKYFVA